METFQQVGTIANELIDWAYRLEYSDMLQILSDYLGFPYQLPLFFLIFFIGKQIPRLAVQRLAQFIQRLNLDRFGLPVL